MAIHVNHSWPDLSGSPQRKLQKVLRRRQIQRCGGTVRAGYPPHGTHQPVPHVEYRGNVIRPHSRGLNTSGKNPIYFSAKNVQAV
jgi:hypothetical protein